MASAAAGIVGGIISSRSQSRAARRAESAQQRATDATIAEQRRQFDQGRADQLPFLQAGQAALGRQEAFLKGDFSGFENSPDYAYARDQMQKGVERGAAARGALYNGGTNVDLARHLGGLASQNANSYWSKLADQAGQGRQTGGGLADLGASFASNYGNAMGNNAAVQGQSAYNRSSATLGGAGLALGGLGDWYANKSNNNGGGSGWYFGRQPGRG